MAPLTEYRRKFKQKGAACQRDYVIRHEYMIGRRSTEMSHTPLDWDVPSDTDSETSSARSEIVSSPKGKQESLRILERESKGKQVSSGSEERPKSNVNDAAAQPQVDKTEVNSKRQQVSNGCAERPKSNFHDAAVQVYKREIKSALGNDERKGTAQCNCLTHPKKTQKSHTSMSQETKDKKEKCKPKSEKRIKPPLIPYGWAYRGPITNHKTFNVQVPEKEACPSALRALKRRQVDIQKKEEQKKYQNLLQKKTEALFNFVEKDDTGWISEYQRNFSGNKIP